MFQDSQWVINIIILLRTHEKIVLGGLSSTGFQALVLFLDRIDKKTASSRISESFEKVEGMELVAHFSDIVIYSHFHLIV